MNKHVYPVLSFLFCTAILLVGVAIGIRVYHADYDKLTAAVEELRDCRIAIQDNCEHEWEGFITRPQCVKCGIKIKPQIIVQSDLEDTHLIIDGSEIPIKAIVPGLNSMSTP